jgi:hypothetical protein
MKVRITESSHWHTGKVGQIFNVRKNSIRGDEYVNVNEPGSFYNGNGLYPGDYEVVDENKIVEHDGVKYQVPGWATYLTRDSSNRGVFAWEKRPEWDRNAGYWTFEGQRHVVQPYIEPLPEGNFFTKI